MLESKSSALTNLAKPLHNRLFAVVFSLSTAAKATSNLYMPTILQVSERMSSERFGFPGFPACGHCLEHTVCLSFAGERTKHASACVGFLCVFVGVLFFFGFCNRRKRLGGDILQIVFPKLNFSCGKVRYFDGFCVPCQFR